MTGFRYYSVEGGSSDISSVGAEAEAKIAAFRREHNLGRGGKIADLLGIKP